MVEFTTLRHPEEALPPRFGQWYRGDRTSMACRVGRLVGQYLTKTCSGSPATACTAFADLLPTDPSRLLTKRGVKSVVALTRLAGWHLSRLQTTIPLRPFEHSAKARAHVALYPLSIRAGRAANYHRPSIMAVGALEVVCALTPC